MQINEIPEIFQSRIRLSALTALMTSEIEFTELKKILNATDGNLSIHLSKLESEGYVETTKQFKGKKPNTRVSITPFGRNQFIEFVHLLESSIKGADSLD